MITMNRDLRVTCMNCGEVTDTDDLQTIVFGLCSGECAKAHNASSERSTNLYAVMDLLVEVTEQRDAMKKELQSMTRRLYDFAKANYK